MSGVAVWTARSAGDLGNARRSANVPTTGSDEARPPSASPPGPFATTASALSADAKTVANLDAAPTTGSTIVAIPGGVRAAGSRTSTATAATVPRLAAVRVRVVHRPTAELPFRPEA